jgi:hypothetical protein
MLDQATDLIGQQQIAMFGFATQLYGLFRVTHKSLKRN